MPRSWSGSGAASQPRPHASPPSPAAGQGKQPPPRGRGPGRRAGCHGRPESPAARTAAADAAEPTPAWVGAGFLFVCWGVGGRLRV
ncbi:hypothetical protein NN561_015350 [Cricetulus griseus]